MKNTHIRKIVLVLSLLLIISCEDFVEIDAPPHRINGQEVFNDAETAQSAIRGVYNQLVRLDYSGGWQNSITALAGLSGDNLGALRPSNITYLEFTQHEILPENSRNLGLWSSAYNVIYMTNAIIEGLENSTIAEDLKLSLYGQAKFIRAFTYFYLTNLYSEVPLLLSTDFEDNSRASRNSKTEIYQQIIIDLTEAIELLPGDYINDDRTTVNLHTARALMARVKLYLENWNQAETLSSQVISETGKYELLDSLDQVFLPNSREALWQISPIGRGNNLTQTNEGSIFIIHPTFPTSSDFKLNESFIALYEPNDLRLNHWIGFHEVLEVYYPFKYKDQNSTNNLTEYSMVMRLSEQYLIRAEARMNLGNIEGAITDINILRKRAGIELILAENLTGDELFQIIQDERRRELFSEWGHRWFDLKRTGRASEIFGSNPLWQDTDVRYPIPEQERMKNANLTQNPGY
ncbi:MAG: RagB/SusD family nutrient uptake outer membrane protein [Gillisia sp.]